MATKKKIAALVFDNIDNKYTQHKNAKVALFRANGHLVSVTFLQVDGKWRAINKLPDVKDLVPCGFDEVNYCSQCCVAQLTKQKNTSNARWKFDNWAPRANVNTVEIVEWP